MKKIFLLTGFITLFVAHEHAQLPTFQWGGVLGGTMSDLGRAIDVDPTGNVYAAGGFSDTADLDPGPGTYDLVSSGLSAMFITKLDNAGNFIWAKQMSHSGFIYAKGISADAAGNVFTTGSFSDTVDFDPGVGVFNLVADGGDIFVSKLDASGNFVWAKQLGGVTVEDVGNSIRVHDSGNIYLTGGFRALADFDPGPGVYNLNSGTYPDCFVCKLDTSGNLIWATQLDGVDPNQSLSIALDPSGNAYTTGIFSNTTDFDPDTGTYNLTASGTDVYVSKLGPSGNLLWAKNMGGITNEYSYSISVDSLENVYTTGYFSGNADFDPGPSTFYLTCTPWETHLFVSKLDASGNLVWAKQIGGAGITEGHSIAVDNGGNVYTTGNFDGTTDFDPGIDTFNLTPAFTDIFISKLNDSGDFVWAVQFGQSTQNGGNGIHVDDANNVYAVGDLSETTDLDPGPGIYNVTSAGQRDAFVLKLSQPDFSSFENNVSINIEIYPNPASEHIKIEGDIYLERVCLIDITGTQILEQNIMGKSGIINISSLENGLYFLQPKGYAQGSTASFKIIVSK